jgi:hypothetical protein
MARYYFIRDLDEIKINEKIIRRVFKCCECGDLKRLLQVFRKIKIKHKIKLINETNEKNLTFACVAAKYSHFKILKYCFELYNKIDSYRSDDILLKALKTAVEYRNLTVIKNISKLLTRHKTSLMCNKLI